MLPFYGRWGREPSRRPSSHSGKLGLHLNARRVYWSGLGNSMKGQVGSLSKSSFPGVREARFHIPCQGESVTQKLRHQVFQYAFERVLNWSKPNGGFPGGASGKEPTCQCRRRKRGRFVPWVRKIPWRRKWQPSPVFFPRESHGRRMWPQSMRSQRVRHDWSDLAHTQNQLRVVAANGLKVNWLFPI